MSDVAQRQIPAARADDGPRESTGSLVHHLLDTARRTPGAPALLLGPYALDYRTLERSTAVVAARLRADGLRAGDRIGLMLPNVPEFAVLYYGVLRAGGVVVPLNPLLKEREVAFHLADSGARALYAWDGVPGEPAEGAAKADVPHHPVSLGQFTPTGTEDLESADALTERGPDDDAVILYTSGTTGHPKGAQLTHRNLASNTAATAGLARLTGADTILGCLPLFHAFGQLTGLNAAVLSGASLALVPRFDPAAVLATLAATRATVFEGVPTMFAGLLHHPDAANADASSLRLCISGGAAMPVEVLHAFEEAFGCDVLEGYGLSETSPVAAFNHLDRPRKAGSIGTPIAGVELSILDPEGTELADGETGELAVRGPNVMKGYWRRPEATAEVLLPDGRLRTGDLARRDEDGFYYIVDRKKDLIIRGGYNVYPRELEEVLYEHPAVLEAAVLPVPDARLGEEVGAAVVLRPGAEETPESLRAWMKERVAAYKYPRRVWFLATLPKGPTGKIQKRDIEVPEAV
ncbi:long-chain fatty acid--CoA ligase [Streptomyces sp. NPDC060243]|uniref:long-chain-fatty-acid--CoA ligase n=1 Tax=Streptomyces sp. NPDC060243 TaxID=3347081 RepID=UPI00365EC556